MAAGTNLSLTLIFIVLSLGLVALNAFFVAAEFAIVKVRRTRLEELAGKGIAAAKASIICVDQLDEYLSATQLGITLVSLALGWIGEASFYSLLLFFFSDGKPHEWLHVVSVVISFSIVTLLHVVFGELVPKTVAIQKAEKVTLLIAPALRAFYLFAKPVISSFTWIANKIYRLFGLSSEGENALTEEELKLVLHDSHEEGVISDSEARIINRTFGFSDKRAIDIMIPIENVAYLSLARTFEQNREFAQKKMYTRFPLARSGVDSILGIVHMKDVLHHPSEWDSNDVLIKVLRNAYYITSDLPLDRLMQMMKKKNVHLAMVQDQKSKKNIGIVTMEDITQELVGKIPDEYGN